MAEGGNPRQDREWGYQPEMGAGNGEINNKNTGIVEWVAREEEMKKMRLMVQALKQQVQRPWGREPGVRELLLSGLQASGSRLGDTLP